MHLIFDILDSHIGDVHDVLYGLYVPSIQTMETSDSTVYGHYGNVSFDESEMNI
jgi:hypothetical protein